MPEQTKQSPEISKPKKRKNPIVTITTVIALGLSCFLLYNVYNEIQTTLELKKKVAQAQEQLAIVEQENDYLTTQKEKLNDEGYIQSYARGKYSVSKEGEQVFYLSPAE